MRGEIYLADLGEPMGHEQAAKRPVLVISADPWLASNPPVVTVVPITRTHRHSPVHVEIESGSSGLQATSYAKCEDIRAVSPKRLSRHYGHVDDVVLAKVGLILQRLLAL